MSYSNRPWQILGLAAACTLAASPTFAADDLLLRTGEEPAALCVDTSGLVNVTLEAANLSQPINGVQARIHYDPALLALVSTNGVVETPWTQVAVHDNPATGEIDLSAVFVPDGNTNGISTNGLVATLTFAIVGQNVTSVGFRADDPPFANKLTVAADNSVIVPATTDSGVIRLYDATADCCDPADGMLTAIDDGLGCTTDVCSTGTGTVTHILDPGACRIDNACYLDAELNPLSDCQACDVATSTNGWTNFAAGTACGDAADTVCDNPNTCDGSGVCLDNFEPDTLECRAAADACDVAEFCDGLGACPTNGFAVDGTTCDDALFCNVGEACSNGVCAGGSARDCSDGDLCTTDLCDENADACGNLDATYLDVNLAVQAVSHAVTREVTFVLSADCGGVLEQHTVPVNIDSDGTAFVALTDSLVQDFRAADYIHAIEGHTLGRRLPLVFDGPDGCSATVNFTGPTAALVAGDFQTDNVAQDNLVDIVDFSILATRWDTLVDECPIEIAPADCARGADATGDGIQDIADFTAIQVNFFEIGDPPLACSTVAAGDRPDLAVRPESHRRYAVSVAHLQALALAGERADLNGDAVIDARDIRLFADRHDIPLHAEFDARLRVLERAQRTPRMSTPRLSNTKTPAAHR